jgi:hypothetical protein
MYLDADSKVVRLAIRLIFTITFTCLGIVGGIVKARQLKLRLLSNHGAIPVADAYGWLRGFDVFGPTRYFHQVPYKSAFWLLMLLTALLSWTTDLLTAAVQQQQVQGLCPFNEGLVFNNSKMDTFYVPPNNDMPALIAGNAQITSLANGCLTGIMRKVDKNPLLCANEADIVGTWLCRQNGADVSFPTNYIKTTSSTPPSMLRTASPMAPTRCGRTLSSGRALSLTKCTLSLTSKLSSTQCPVRPIRRNSVPSTAP